MADRSTRTPNASQNDDALATMNEHLARFFEQADTLLEEWKAYGEGLRATLDAQARALEATVARAIEQAGREASSALSAHMEETLRASLETLGREVDAMSQRVRAASRIDTRVRADTSDPARALAVHQDTPIKARPWQSGVVLLGLTLANVILAALLVSSIRSCRGEVYEHRSGSGWGPPVDAHPGARDSAPAAPADAATGDAAQPAGDAAQEAPERSAPDRGKAGDSDGKTGAAGDKSDKSDAKTKAAGGKSDKARSAGDKRDKKGSSP